MYTKLIIFGMLFSTLTQFVTSESILYNSYNSSNITNDKLYLTQLARNFYKSRDIETNIEDATNNLIFQRKLTESKSPESLEFESENEHEEHSRRKFKFSLKTTPHGVMLKFRSDMEDINTKEVTFVMFQKMFTFEALYNNSYVNETMENVITFSRDIFNPMICTTNTDYKTCNLTTSDGKFCILVDYSATPYQKTSLVITKQMFSTDIKVTLIFNQEVPFNHKIGLITTFKTEIPHEVESEDDKLYTTDKSVTIGNYSYFSFETIALTELEEIVNVTMTKTTLQHLVNKNVFDNNYESQVIYQKDADDFNPDDIDDIDNDDDDDEKEKFTIFTFSSHGNLTKIIWDPTIGASTAFTGVDLTQSQQTTNTDSSSNFPVYGIVLLAVGCSLLVFVAVGVVIQKIRLNTQNKKYNDLQMRTIS